MTQENVSDIVERISVDKSFKEKLLKALGQKSSEDKNFRKELLITLDTGSQARSSLKANTEFILQLLLSGILIVIFVVVAVLTFIRIDMAPQAFQMGDNMQMYDPFVRAKDLLTLLIPLFTTTLSFWLGFSLQEKKVNQERGKREKADEMMAKIKGRTMVEDDNPKMLREHINQIMEVPQQNGDTA